MTDTLTGDAAIALPEFDAPPARPDAVLAAWLRRAAERGVREALAATLATATPEGIPSSRTVLLKEVTADCVLFGTSAESRKGRELAANPRASVTLYWRELLQQIRLDGPVERLDAAASDALFADRAPDARAATAASRQSEPLADPARLRERRDALLAAPEPPARPADWHGYRLVPATIELWHGSPDRLHRRLRYERDAGGAWRVERLQP